MDLHGKGILITGATSGIGHATARALAAEGARLALSGRRTAMLESLAALIGPAGAPRPAVLPADLSSPGAAADLARRACTALDEVDVVINSAGEFELGWQWDLGDGEAARRLFETNYWAPMALVRALVPAMRARGAGAVVNLASLSTVTPLPRLGAYAAAKAALTSATETLRLELRGTGVQTILLFLGSVDTPMHAKALRSFGSIMRWMPLGRPERLARLIVTALQRDRDVVVYPRVIGAIRLAPALSARISARLLVPFVRPAAG